MYTANTLLKLMTMLLFVKWNFGISPEEGLMEYCQLEFFNPVCADDEVVVMESARYGHIKIGRCIDEDIGPIGCYLNQLSVMDRLCSGRQSCKEQFSDSLMEEEFPCTLSKSFVRYLEASFRCHKVFTPQAGQCSNPTQVSATSRISYLSSGTTEKFGCGEQTKPWIIKTKEGQKINVSFIDFNWKLKSGSQATVACPKKYGYIVDELSNDVVNLCGGLVRERNLYTSKGNKLQILLAKSVLNDVKFLISYEAVGCPKYKVAPETWIEESNGYITVGCVATTDKWKMRCIGNHWLGPLKDCSQYATHKDSIKSASSQGEENTLLNMPPAVAFALFGGIVLICISIVTTVVIGIFCIRKSGSKSQNHVTSGETIKKPPLLLPLDNFPTYKSVHVKLPRKKEAVGSMIKPEDPFGSFSTLPSLGSVPRRPPSMRESPHYYLLEGRETPETEPLYDVVYQGYPTENNA